MGLFVQCLLFFELFSKVSLLSFYCYLVFYLVPGD